MIEVVQKLLSGVLESSKEDGDRNLSTSVDPNMEKIFLIKLEINPRAPVGDNPPIVEDLPAAVGFDLILIEKDAGGAMELADNHPFGPVHNKRSVFGHQGDFAKIDFLLFYGFDALGLGLFIHIPDH